jgi:hypothetical protein
VIGEERLQQEVFFLAYHLHWGHAEVIELSTAERRNYVRMLVEQLEREQQAVEQAKRR